MRVGCSQLAQIRAKSVAGCDSTSSRVCRCLRVVKELPSGGERTRREVYGKEATKGVWWMPWHQEATKDVANCDMQR